MTEAFMLSDAKRRLLEGLLAGAAGPTADRIESRPAGEIAPISAEQRQVWLHASMAPDQPLYNEAITIHRRGSFSLETLEKAFNEVLRRHEIWRSSIELRDGDLWLIPHDLELGLPLVDLTDLPRADRDAAARRLAEDDARTPIDLAKAPLLRARVVRMAPDYHRLYLTLHHIIFDGVSIYRVLMPELAALYAAFGDGRPSPLPEPKLQYADFALWRARRLSERPMERELAYWRTALAGELSELRLPSDRRASSVPTHAGSMETFELSPQLTLAVKAFAASEGVTQYVALLAAFKAMLARTSGQNDIVIGAVTDMRRRPELEGVIGYFLNSLPLRTRPKPEMSFRDYAAEVQQTVVAALDASELPFDRIVRAVKPRRESARHPLFQVLFSIEPPAPPFPEGWDLTQMDVTVGSAKFDLYLELDERHDRLIGRFLYSTELFEPAAIRRMIGHWITLLEGALAAPNESLARLPLLSKEEQAEILRRRNATAADFPVLTLDALIERQARETPNAVAVESGGERWNYAELDRRAEQIAQRLRAAGVIEGDLVAILMQRSAGAVAGLIAILKCGAAYLPLDPTLPEARLRLLMGDARPVAILADRPSAQRAPRSPARLVMADGACWTPDVAPRRRSRRSDPSDPVYVLYTSGSTGRPKAVATPHRAVVNLLTAIRREIGFVARDRLLAVTTLSFDIAALEIFLPLIAGGRVIMASSADVADPVRLARLIERTRPAVMQATPAGWRALIGVGWSGDSDLKILCGGEALSPDLAQALAARGAGCWNLYGPTETTIWSLIAKLNGGEDPVPIGRPLANTRVYVLDRQGAPVPDLAAGELAIAGDGLALGYRGDPGLTAAKFVTLAAPIGERAYLTGDMVRWRPDGLLEFLGRTDNQVKVRGFRVGLEELESAITGHPRVTAAGVRCDPDASGETSLIGYVAGDGFGEADIPALRAFLSERLPAYMVPSRFAVLPALPMTPNGKVDRKRLPKIDPVGAPDATEPRDGLERTLAEIWSEVLGVERPGVHDNFFDLGGHSLLASLLMAKIKARLERDLPLALLFQSPTIATLADTLRSLEAPSFSHLVPLKTGGERRPLFIVHGVYGNVLQLKGLAARLDAGRSIYALQARGADPAQAPHETIDEMAMAYLAAVRSAQPAGPYALAGYSFGGLIAYEMARRLRAEGEAVDVLAMLETDLCERFLPWPRRIDYVLSWPLRAFAKLATLPFADIGPYLARKAAEAGQTLKARIGFGEPFAPSEASNGSAATRQREMYRIGVREWRRFRPGPFDGALSVFRVKGPRFDACNPVTIWRRVAASVEVFEIEGRHEAIMERPFVDVLAAQLDRCLAASERGSEPPAAHPPSGPLERRPNRLVWPRRAGAELTTGDVGG
jgi:amino acid adenylation domain-containing protein